MADPKRWLLSLRDPNSLERRLMVVGTDLTPPPDAERDVWARIARAFAPGAAGGADPNATGHGSTTAGAAGPGSGVGTAGSAGLVGKSSALVLLKGLLAGIVATGGAMTVVHEMDLLSARGSTTSERRAVVSSPAVGVPASAQRLEQGQDGVPVALARVGPLPAATPEPRKTFVPPTSANTLRTAPARSGLEFDDSRADTGADDASPAPSLRSEAPSATANAASVPGAVSEPSALGQEARTLARAKNLLVDGDAVAALSILDQVARDYPDGTLALEREALLVEALALAGHWELARRHSRRFIEHHPRSPLVGRIQSLIPPE